MAREPICRGRNALEQPQSILKFVVLVAASSLLIGASAAVAAAALTGLGQGQNLVLLWFNFWLGSVLGSLVITPLVLAWTAGGGLGLSVKRCMEAAALLLTLLLLCLALFGECSRCEHILRRSRS